MAQFTFRVAGHPDRRQAIEAPDTASARNQAIQFLAALLQADPEFASEGHWTVHVDDQSGRSLLHVVIATVSAANGTFGR
jgi:hypothetical protein